MASRQSQPRYHHHLNFHYALIHSILNARHQGHTVFTKIKLLKIIPPLQRSTDKKWKHPCNKVWFANTSLFFLKQICHREAKLLRTLLPLWIGGRQVPQSDSGGCWQAGLDPRFRQPAWPAQRGKAVLKSSWGSVIVLLFWLEINHSMELFRRVPAMQNPCSDSRC